MLMISFFIATAPTQVFQAPLENQGPHGNFPRPLVELSSSPPSQAPSLPSRKADLVLRWNEMVLQAIKADKTSPPLAARNLAMVHVAIYDAVNAVFRTHRPLKVDAAPTGETAAEAAVAIAAHRVLVELYPDQVNRLDTLLDESLAEIPEGPPKKEGILLGQFVAEKILTWRAADGVATPVPYRLESGPGKWQPTPPNYHPALLPQWSRVTCFAMKEGNQFRPPDPPSLQSAAYRASFNEVKALGSKSNSARTLEQTQIAFFWADGDGTVTPPGHWNRIAQTVALARGNTLPENARLFALLDCALADAAIVAWDCKFKYDFWRPIQAIRDADPAGDLAGQGDPDWTPLLPTPPFPSYTSGHSTFSAAAATVLATFFGKDQIPFTCTSEGLPGTTRSFSGFWEAAKEAGRSRVYGGIHWEFDNVEGLASGQALGRYVCQNILTPRTTDSSAKISLELAP